MTLYLYAPSQVLGGTETLALRLAGELCQRGVDAVLVTTSGGWLHREATSQSLPVVELATFEAGSANDGDRVIASAKYLLDKTLEGWRVRTLFWLLHPLEFIWTRFPRIYGLYRHMDARGCGRFLRWTAPLLHARLRGEFDALLRTHRLVSMSEDCTAFTTRCLGRKDAVLPLVPLPIAARKLPPVPPAPSEPIGFAYFGRIEQFKTASIRRLIDDIAASVLPIERKSLVLFGYGADEAIAREHAERCGVRLEITGATTVEAVAARARADRLLTFAMGLSGLDLLIAGVPCVFMPIPCSTNNLSGNYSFLHQLPWGCVGSYPEFLDATNSMNFERVCREATETHMRNNIALDLKRIEEAHALDAVVDALLARLGNAFPD